MKKILFALTMLACVASALPKARGDDVSIDFFYNNLSGGNWIEVGDYGYGWQPDIAVSDPNWRPYSDGYWAYTDYGWTWISYEDFGWATYHYGRWDMNAEFGWFWVPQIVWAPAWVSWHEGGGYVGWAPLSPAGRIDVAVIGPRIVFVEERRFLEPVRIKTVVVNNTTIINKTVINKGPETVVIEKASGKKIQPVQVTELRHKEEAAVVVKQGAPKATSEKKEKSVQTPARSEAEPTEKKAAPAKEQRQVEKPAAGPMDTEAPALKKQDTQNEKGKREVKPQAEQPSKPEGKSEAKPENKREAKPEAEKSNKHEAKPEGKGDGEKHDQKQEKPDKESEKKGEGQQAPQEK
jgi:hypothetical protein